MSGGGGKSGATACPGRAAAQRATSTYVGIERGDSAVERPLAPLRVDEHDRARSVGGHLGGALLQPPRIGDAAAHQRRAAPLRLELAPQSSGVRAALALRGAEA